MRSAIPAIIVFGFSFAMSFCNAVAQPSGLPAGTSEIPVQLRAQNAGQLLYIDENFAIHQNAHFSDVMGQDLCNETVLDPRYPSETSGDTALTVILNAAPDFRVTPQWLELEFRPVLDDVVKNYCPGTKQAKVFFYIRGLDFVISQTALDDAYAWINGEWAQLYQVDRMSYPEVYVYKQRSSQWLYVENEDGGFRALSPNPVGWGFLSAYFFYFENMSASDRDRIRSAIQYRDGKFDSTIGEDYYYFHHGSDGSLIDRVNDINEEFARLRRIAAERKAQYIFNVQMVLAMSSAWACGNDYQAWCNNIMPAIGSIGSTPD